MSVLDIEQGRRSRRCGGRLESTIDDSRISGTDYNDINLLGIILRFSCSDAVSSATDAVATTNSALFGCLDGCFELDFSASAAFYDLQSNWCR